MAPHLRERPARVTPEVQGQGARVLTQLLLISGAFSSLLYIATDIFGGLRYPGYSFTSQAISELAAKGAPSEHFVDPLFLAYSVLVLALGIGVLRIAAQHKRTLRIVAAALIAYAAVGGVASLADVVTSGQISFAMNQRGAGTLSSDAPHIILTAVLVALWLAATGFGAVALGKHFRRYTHATMFLVIVLGAVMGRYASLLAAGRDTPGMGIVERIEVYSVVVWIGVLALALLRAPRDDHRGFRLSAQMGQGK